MTSSFFHRSRSGTSLVELLLFLAFFAIVSGTIVSILFATNDQRVRQQVVASVERTGLQILQSLKWRIEHSERILDPAIGQVGSILALQMASENDNPMIIAQQNGSLVFVLRESKKQLTPEGTTISHFTVRNTSASVSRPSVLLSFDLSEIYPLPSSAIQEYTRHFEMLVTPFAEDDPQGGDCGCAVPSCQAETYHWEVCSDQICTPTTITLSCP